MSQKEAFFLMNLCPSEELCSLITQRVCELSDSEGVSTRGAARILVMVGKQRLKLLQAARCPTGVWGRSKPQWGPGLRSISQQNIC